MDGFDPFNNSNNNNREQRDITRLFAERTKELIQESAKVAHAQKLRAIDTEHILFALSERDGVMDEVFKTLKINEKELQNYLSAQFYKGNFDGSNLILTPRAKQVIQMAFQEALALNHRYIGTEHIFLGLIREGEGLGAQALLKFGVTLEDARKAVVKAVGEGDKDGTGVKGKSKTPTLDSFSKDLSTLAEQNKIDPVIGRSAEITRVIEILSRRKKNNPVLIGEPGVGKTAIVEGLAQRITTGNIPEILKGKRVKSLDLTQLVAGAKFRGEFEERAKKLIKELEESERDIILFIDELHTIVGSGAKEGELDFSNMIKPALARGELQVIGATTLNEYKKYIEKDAALERRFQPILVKEPTVDETIQILQGIRDRYEAHHRLKISDAALEAAAQLSDRYIKDRFLPDKAIDVVDEASSKLRLESTSEPEELRVKRLKIDELESERESLTRANKLKDAAELKVDIEKIKAEIEPMEEEWRRKKGTGTPTVDFNKVAEVISNVTGIPITQLSKEDKSKLLRLDQELAERVVGQEEAVKLVAEAVKRAHAGLQDPSKPIATMMFLGPTGVGKTELTKALADVLFNTQDAMIRVDMSEYMESHSVARLIGSPPGYVGFDEGGQLTEKVRRQPYSVILLDEIEKAHPDVLNILLQLFDDGHLTDGKGRKVDFKNTIIIATSNVGADAILAGVTQNEFSKARKKMIEDEKKKMPSTNLIKMKTVAEDEIPDIPKVAWSKTKDSIMQVVQQKFKPEFINRIDEIVIFNRLSKNNLLRVVDLQIKDLKERLQSKNIDLDVEESARVLILETNYNPLFGARPIKRAITRMLENPLSEQIISEEIKSGDKIIARNHNGFIEFNFAKSK